VDAPDLKSRTTRNPLSRERAKGVRKDWDSSSLKKKKTRGTVGLEGKRQRFSSATRLA